MGTPTVKDLQNDGQNISNIVQSLTKSDKSTQQLPLKQRLTTINETIMLLQSGRIFEIVNTMMHMMQVLALNYDRNDDNGVELFVTFEQENKDYFILLWKDVKLIQNVMYQLSLKFVTSALSTQSVTLKKDDYLSTFIMDKGSVTDFSIWEWTIRVCTRFSKMLKMDISNDEEAIIVNVPYQLFQRNGKVISLLPNCWFTPGKEEHPTVTLTCDDVGVIEVVPLQSLKQLKVLSKNSKRRAIELVCSGSTLKLFANFLRTGSIVSPMCTMKNIFTALNEYADALIATPLDPNGTKRLLNVDSFAFLCLNYLCTNNFVPQKYTQKLETKFSTMCGMFKNNTIPHSIIITRKQLKNLRESMHKQIVSHQKKN